MLELGSSEQNIIKQAVRSGQPIPDRIANAPEVSLGLLFYLQAFFDLDAERSQGFGFGRIPWSATLQYASYYELDDETTDNLFRYIRLMDTAYLNYREEQRQDG